METRKTPEPKPGKAPKAPRARESSTGGGGECFDFAKIFVGIAVVIAVVIGAANLAGNAGGYVILGVVVLSVCGCLWWNGCCCSKMTEDEKRSKAARKKKQEDEGSFMAQKVLGKVMGKG